MSDKKRADVALVERGLAASREKAQALIMSGLVYISQVRVDKASVQVRDSDELLVRSAGTGYVSRGALKLVKGLDMSSVDPGGRICMDVGASTGGFTDVLLHRGAARVYAIDVGYGQLDWKLREDPRVVVMERTNARYLEKDALDPRPSLAVMDVSFISIEKVLPALVGILGEEGEIITLIKPQFEAGRERVGKKGVVRDPEVHLDVVRRIVGFTRDALGWVPVHLAYSPIRGPEGNIEFLLHMKPLSDGTEVTDERVKTIVREAQHGVDAS